MKLRVKKKNFVRSPSEYRATIEESDKNDPFLQQECIITSRAEFIYERGIPFFN